MSADAHVTPADAPEFVRRHGVVLASSKGGVPNLADAVAGESIRGSWWGHREGKRIFAALSAVESDEDVLTCRLVDGRKTFVHARLWPALVRCAAHFPAAHLSRTHERHTSTGAHRREEIAFPEWVPPNVRQAALGLDEAAALQALREAGVPVPAHRTSDADES